MIYVGSLKYSPVYKSHCCAFGNACEEAGFHVKYLFSHDYKWMLPSEIENKTVFIGHSNSISSMVYDTINIRNLKLINNIFKEKPSHIYLHNYHFLNHNITKKCKKNNCKFIYHVHEPYVANKSEHGGAQQYWLHASEYMQTKLLKSTDVAIVSSDEGSRLFDKAFPWFKKRKLLVPLMYEDLGDDNNHRKREFITFVGPPVPAKGPDIFLKIVDYAAKQGLDWSFLLISRSKVTDNTFTGKSNLEIVYKNNLSDEEYGDLIKRSILVLTPYRRETQSSVVLVSYMYGTPIVSSTTGGLPEFVEDDKTGYLVDLNASIETWIERINLTIENSQRLSANCRVFFTDRFAGKNWSKYLPNVLA